MTAGRISNAAVLPRSPSAKLWTEDRCAKVVGRIAYVFKLDPTLERVIVYVSTGGYIRVTPFLEQRAPSQLIGVYGRNVTIGQLLEDVAG